MAKAACALALLAMLALAPLAEAAESVPIPGGWGERMAWGRGRALEAGCRCQAVFRTVKRAPPPARSERELQPDVLEEAR